MNLLTVITGQGTQVGKVRRMPVSEPGNPAALLGSDPFRTGLFAPPSFDEVACVTGVNPLPMSAAQ